MARLDLFDQTDFDADSLEAGEFFGFERGEGSFAVGCDIVAQGGEAGGLERGIAGGGIEAWAQGFDSRGGFGEGGDPAAAGGGHEYLEAGGRGTSGHLGARGGL